MWKDEASCSDDGAYSENIPPLMVLRRTTVCYQPAPSAALIFWLSFGATAPLPVSYSRLQRLWWRAEWQALRYPTDPSPRNRRTPIGDSHRQEKQVNIKLSHCRRLLAVTRGLRAPPHHIRLDSALFLSRLLLCDSVRSRSVQLRVCHSKLLPVPMWKMPAENKQYAQTSMAGAPQCVLSV